MSVVATHHIKKLVLAYVMLALALLQLSDSNVQLIMKPVMNWRGVLRLEKISNYGEQVVPRMVLKKRRGRPLYNFINICYIIMVFSHTDGYIKSYLDQQLI